MKAKRRICNTTLLLLVATLLAATLADKQALAQEASPEERARQAYLEAHGLEQRAAAIEQELLAELRASGMMQGRQEEFAESFAFILALQGLSVAEMERLEEEGVGVMDFVSAGPGASLVETAVATEVVVIGEVKDYIVTLEPGDGYRSSVIIEVIETLKGEIPADKIVLRQPSGLGINGKYGVRVSTDLRPEPGQRYLFYLSNSLYRYRTAHPALYGLAEDVRGNTPQATKGIYFIHWHQARRLEEGVLQSAPSLRSPTRSQTEQIFERIRELDRILESVK